MFEQHGKSVTRKSKIWIFSAAVVVDWNLGTLGISTMDEFPEKIQTTFDPPSSLQNFSLLIFLEVHDQHFTQMSQCSAMCQ